MKLIFNILYMKKSIASIASIELIKSIESNESDNSLKKILFLIG